MKTPQARPTLLGVLIALGQVWPLIGRAARQHHVDGDEHIRTARVYVQAVSEELGG